MSRSGSASRAVLALVAAVAAVLALPGAAVASPSESPEPTAKVECVAFNNAGTRCEVLGMVYALAQIGQRTYIGGEFTTVSGEPRSNLAAIRRDGSLDPTWTPTVDGTVYALAVSADGSMVYLGGGFTEVGGQRRSRLAAVTADTGEPVPGWSTGVNTNLVRALVADSSGRLYVGGNYTRIDGNGIPRLAVVRQSDGEVDASFAPRPTGTVRALALSDDGSLLYAGGGFSAIDGVARSGVAELVAATGAATAFDPTDGGVVISIDVSSSGRLFFGATNNRTWAYDPAVGNQPLYRVRTGGDVQAILEHDGEVYIGGHFTRLPEHKLDRRHIASFRAADGEPTAWNPGVNGNWGVWAFGLTRTSLSPDEPPALSVVGDFTRVNGTARRGYARFLF